MLNRIKRIRQLVDMINAIDMQISNYYGMVMPRTQKNNAVNRLSISRKNYELELAKMGITFECRDTSGAHCLDVSGLDAVLNAIERKKVNTNE